MNILLISPYDAVSHGIWRRGVKKALSGYSITELILADRYFAWRQRGNSLSLAYKYRDVLSAGYDLIIATSMTDLSALTGMCPEIADIPKIVYFHENQFDYPQSKSKHSSIEPKITNLYTALASDINLFNSEYNLRTFIEGTESLLRKMPDEVPAGIGGVLRAKSSVLPVPVDDEWFGVRSEKTSRFSILWNHRWEYDKAPERFLKALEILKDNGKGDFELKLLGQNFRNAPQAYSLIKEKFAENIATCGYIEDINEYRREVSSAHVVVSTSLHDFQGLSIMEACAAGVCPVVPDRLAYSEYIPQEYRYESYINDSDADSLSAAKMLTDRYDEFKKGQTTSAPDIEHLKTSALSDTYKLTIEKVLNTGSL